MNFLQLLSSLAGLVSFGATVIGAFFLVKSRVGHSTNEAQESAINAMRTELDTLRDRIEDKDKDNARLSQKINHLEQTMETVFAALKKQGFLITIQGEMVYIEDKRGNSTTTRIRRVAGAPDDDL